MKKLIAFLVIISLCSFGTQEEKKITLILTPDEVGLVYSALGKLPAETVEPLRAKIAQEYTRQMADTVKKK